ncbi:MAG: tetratricopeptide repeat protein [Myxococcales bacterium]|nr:tetratricopeptide repeat protein [Myxococcales bacterium]
MRQGGPRAREAIILVAALLAACSSTPPPEDPPLDADPPGPVEVGSKGPKRPAGLDGAIELVKAGKFADAVPALKKALDEEPRSAEAAFYLGLATEQTGGSKQEAEKLYKQALAFDAGLVEAANNLAAIYLEEPPRPEQAIPVLKKALAADPENVSLLTNLGYAYGLKNDVDSASKAYEAALAKGPSAQLSFSYGVMLFENKRAEQAVPHLVKAAEGIEDAPTLATIGRMLGPGKAFAECVKVLDKAIGLKKDAAEFYVRRGVCKHELDQEKEAGSDFEAAIKIDEKFQAAHYYLAQSLFAQGNGLRAKQELRTAWELGRETPIGKQAKDMLDGKKKPPPKGGAKKEEPKKDPKPAPKK